MIKDLTKIVFVRHGETSFTRDLKIYGNAEDPSLTNTGEKQLELTATYLTKKYMPSKIYSSPSARTRESAAIIAKKFNVDTEILDQCTERQAGQWGNHTIQEIKTQYPQMYANYEKDKINYIPPKGESLNQHYDRTRKILAPLIDENTEKTIFIVTHSGVIQAYISYILGIPLENIGSLYIPVASVTEINCYEDWCGIVLAGYCPYERLKEPTK